MLNVESFVTQAGRWNNVSGEDGDWQVKDGYRGEVQE